MLLMPLQPSTPEENALALKKVTRATIELCSSTKFVLLSGILSSLRHSTALIPTACTDGLRVKWGTRFVLSLKPKNIAFIAAHEAGHSFFMHNETAKRLHAIDPERCACALDQAINNFLVDCDPDETVIAMPREPDGTPMGQLDRKYQGMSSYEIFKLLPQTPKGKRFDVHDFKDQLTPEEVKELDMAITAGKRASDAVQTRQRSAEESQTPRRNYGAMLAQWLYGRGKGLSLATWRQPNRRMIHRGIYLPSKIGKALRKAVFACDTSGSIQGEELNQSITTFKEIVKQLGCEELHILYWDSGVRRHETYRYATGKSLSQTQPAGGGGTSFAPVQDYLKAQNIVPDVMIVTTDGYVSDYGPRPKYPTLFMVSTDQTPPWGEVVRA